MAGFMAEMRLSFGQRYPYDQGETGPAPSSGDWAVKAARGVLADLSDRRGIKWELGKVEHDIRKEIVQSLADIIRLAQATKGDE